MRFECLYDHLDSLVVDHTQKVVSGHMKDFFTFDHDVCGRRTV